MEQQASAAAPPDVIRQLREKLALTIRGKLDVIEHFLIAVLADGSILLEDVPGVGKTTLAKAFAEQVGLEFHRIQSTPDLLPADVFGFSVFNAKDGTFEFRPGPVFCNMLLVDEINRASPRTQSALLEAMAEQQVTTEGVRRSLESPFLVVATQNPTGFHGTYPLPESQLDRFLFHLSMDYPDLESEVDILYAQHAKPADCVTPCLSREMLLDLQQKVTEVDVHRDVARYIIRIVRSTRTDDRLQLGSSPRGAQMLFRAAQAAAFVDGRAHVVPDDVQRVAPLTLAHRVVALRGDNVRHSAKREIIDDILAQVDVPA